MTPESVRPAAPFRGRFAVLAALLLTALALPWIALAVLAAPGRERPLVTDVASWFLIAEAWVLQAGIEDAFRLCRLVPALLAVSLCLLNALALALRLRAQPGTSRLVLVHVAFIVLFAAGLALLHRFVLPLVGRGRKTTESPR